LPLAALNAASWLVAGEPISLEGAFAAVDRSAAGLLATARGYLELGAGGAAAELVLGLPRSTRLAGWESSAAAATLLLASAFAVTVRRDPRARWAALTLASYCGILGALLALPRPTWVHHWVIGTPFQYLAVALALSLARSAWTGRGLAGAGRSRVRALALALGLTSTVWLGVRVVTLLRVERALWEGRASRGFHPDLAELGAFAASRADRAVFVATDWGVATQIHCLANGSPGLVHEPFWRYGGLEEIHAIQRGSGKPLLYLVRPEPAPGVGGAATRRIERDVTRSSDWVELPLDSGARWPTLSLRKLAYRGPLEDPGRGADPPRRRK
jgi:hypothetical protein